MVLPSKKFILLSFICVLLAIFFVRNYNQLSIKEVQPDQIGLRLDVHYKYENNIPIITFEWAWNEHSATIKNAQDLIGLLWENPEQWIISTNSIEGGGGPGLMAIEQLKSNEKGFSYIGKPLNENGHVTFKLLCNPPKATAKPPRDITVFFIHPQRNLLGNIDIYLIKDTIEMSTLKL